MLLEAAAKFVLAKPISFLHHSECFISAMSTWEPTRPCKEVEEALIGLAHTYHGAKNPAHPTLLL